MSFATWRFASTRARWDDEEQPRGAGVQEEHHDGLQGQPLVIDSLTVSLFVVSNILPSPSIIQIILKITKMVFKGAVEERDRDGKRSQALYAFPPEASVTEFIGLAPN